MYLLWTPLEKGWPEAVRERLGKVRFGDILPNLETYVETVWVRAKPVSLSPSPLPLFFFPPIATYLVYVYAYLLVSLLQGDEALAEIEELIHRILTFLHPGNALANVLIGARLPSFISATGTCIKQDTNVDSLKSG